MHSTSLFPTNVIPVLGPGGTPSGSAMVPRPEGSQATEYLTSVNFLQSLGDDRLKMGPLVAAASRTWGDIDLQVVNAGNAMMLSDTLSYKLNTTTGASALTGVLAPKVLVPPNINTFKGRSFQYNVVPATTVPKRGTVRTMTKTVREWQTNMKQSGIGSQIEGGAYRSPQGRVFLEQELTAFVLSLEMNICLSTAETAVLTAITKPFRDPSRSDVSDATLGKQIARELNSFCCAGGSSGLLAAVLSERLTTIPAASMIFMPLTMTQNLRFNDRGGPMKFDNQSVSMVEFDGRSRAALVKNGSTSSLYTIFGGKLAVMEMPTFTFQEGQSAYQPLEHEMTVTEYFVLGPNKGLSCWYDIQPNNIAGPNMQDYTPKDLTVFAYDHTQDNKSPVHYLSGLEHSFIFNISNLSGYASTLSERDKMYDPKLLDFIPKFEKLLVTNTVPVVNTKDLVAVLDNYTVNPDMYMQAVPISYATTKTGSQGTTQLNIVENVTTVKRNLQYPLTSRVSMNGQYNNFGTATPGYITNKRTCLPNCVGDLDPAHLSANFFMTMIGDIQNALYETLSCSEASKYYSLRSQLLETPFDKNYFDLLIAENLSNLSKSTSEQSATGNHDSVQKFIKAEFTGFPLSDLFPKKSWPVNHGTDLISIPDETKYKNYMSSSQNSFGVSREVAFQGLWSARGLTYLAKSSTIGTGNLSKTAADVLFYLQCLWQSLTKMLPQTIFTNMTNHEQLAMFVGLGFPDVQSALNVGLSDIDGIQLIMNMLDSDMDLYYVGLDTSPDGSPQFFKLAYEDSGMKNLFLSNKQFVIFDSSLSNNSNPARNLQSADTVKLLFSLYDGKTWAIQIKDTQMFNLIQPILQAFVLTPMTSNFYIEAFMNNLTNITLPSVDKPIDESFTNLPKSSVVNQFNDAQKFFIYSLLAELLRVSYEIAETINTQKPPSSTAPIFQLNSGKVTAVSSPAVQNYKDIYTEIENYLSSLTPSNLLQISTSFTTQPKKTKRALNLDIRSTGLVLSYKQLPKTSNGDIDTTQLGNVRLYSRFGISSTGFSSLKGATTEHHSLVYKRNLNKFLKQGRLKHIFQNFQINPTNTSHVNNTLWMEKRMEMFCDAPLDQSKSRDWDNVKRLLSTFLCHTQMNYASAKKMVLSQIRPLCDVVCFRSPCFIMNSILLAVPGLSTMFNPYTNPHIGMARDGHTDQYAIRAVVETATVVLNAQNVDIVLGASPVSYCHGRNTKFVSDPDTMFTRDTVNVNLPSLIACAVSHGLMPCMMDDPVSFINKPPCTITNGITDDVKESQRWPGGFYYGRNIYKKHFEGVQANPTIQQGQTEEQQQREYLKWLVSNTSSGHVAFRAQVNVYNPIERAYSHAIPGTGHLKQIYMNVTGAKDFFEGRSTTPITSKYQETAGYN